MENFAYKMLKAYFLIIYYSGKILPYVMIPFGILLVYISFGKANNDIVLSMGYGFIIAGLMIYIIEKMDVELDKEEMKDKLVSKRMRKINKINKMLRK